MLNVIAAATNLLAIIVTTLNLSDRVRTYLNSREKHQLARVITLLYIRINDCISTGEQILDSLLYFVQNTNSISYSGKYEIHFDGILLSGLIARQREQLDMLSDCIRQFSKILRSMDDELYLQLVQFIAFKGVGLEWIETLLSRGIMPFDGLTIEDVKFLALRANFMLDSSDESDVITDPTIEGVVENTRQHFLPWYGEVSIISRRIDQNAIQIDSLFDSTETDFKLAVNEPQLSRLGDLLQRNDLRQHLEEAKNGARQLKEFIEKNFSVVEILMDVGSQELKKKMEW